MVIALATPIADIFLPRTFDSISYPVLWALLLIVADKKSLFRDSSIGETGSVVNENVTGGYCGCDNGPQYGDLNVGHGWMC
ncbi:MAG: hypothetical protein JRL30_02070 [Deltaproteobacteria bacterium]|nr:hypothetical protein [Deltaproteobacteria bacterium]